MFTHVHPNYPKNIENTRAIRTHQNTAAPNGPASVAPFRRFWSEVVLSLKWTRPWASKEIEPLGKSNVEGKCTGSLVRLDPNVAQLAPIQILLPPSDTPRLDFPNQVRPKRVGHLNPPDGLAIDQSSLSRENDASAGLVGRSVTGLDAWSPSAFKGARLGRR